MNSKILLLLSLFLWFIGTFICFDILGALLMAGGYLFWMSNESLLFLAYPIWIVVAIFNGFYFASVTTEKFTASDSLLKKEVISCLIAFTSSIFLLVFFHYFKQMNSDGFDNYWVPGNAGLTYAYFISLQLSVIIYYTNQKKVKS